jgi:hypothetical protein
MIEKGNPLGNKTFATIPSPQGGRSMFECLLPDISRFRPPILFLHHMSSLLSEDATAVSDGAGGAFGGRPLRALSALSVFYFLFSSIKKAFFLGVCWLLEVLAPNSTDARSACQYSVYLLAKCIFTFYFSLWRRGQFSDHDVYPGEAQAPHRWVAGPKPWKSQSLVE